MFPVNPLGSVNLQSINSNSTNVSCDGPEQYMWVYHVFRECIYSTKEEVGFILGLISICCWIFASLPQLYENYKNGKADESLSIWFILFWLLGDSSNLIGCILTQQFPIQLYTAIYYVSMDMIMLVQFLYYKYKHRRQQSGRGVINEALASSSSSERILCCLCLAMFFPLWFMAPGSNIVDAYSIPRIGRSLLSVNLPTPTHSFVWTTETTIGYAIGCLSSFFYLGSRLPQILKNYNRGRTEGVAPIMFVLAITGNTLYGASILLQDPDPGSTWGQFILFHLPWLIGSIGTLLLDLTILLQIMYYSKKCPCHNAATMVRLNEDDETDQNEVPLVI